jgi:hypothetical protein
MLCGDGAQRAYSSSSNHDVFCIVFSFCVRLSFVDLFVDLAGLFVGLFVDSFGSMRICLHRVMLERLPGRGDAGAVDRWTVCERGCPWCGKYPEISCTMGA